MRIDAHARRSALITKGHRYQPTVKQWHASGVRSRVRWLTDHSMTMIIAMIVYSIFFHTHRLLFEVSCGIKANPTLATLSATSAFSGR